MYLRGTLAIGFRMVLGFEFGWSRVLARLVFRGDGPESAFNPKLCRVDFHGYTSEFLDPITTPRDPYTKNPTLSHTFCKCYLHWAILAP